MFYEPEEDEEEEPKEEAEDERLLKGECHD
jgi:hypothetical protein